MEEFTAAVITVRGEPGGRAGATRRIYAGSTSCHRLDLPGCGLGATEREHGVQLLGTRPFLLFDPDGCERQGLCSVV